MSDIVLLDERLVPLYSVPRAVGASLGLKDRQRPYISDIIGHVYQGKDCMVRFTEDKVAYKVLVDLSNSGSVARTLSHQTIQMGRRPVYMVKTTTFKKPETDRKIAIDRFEPLISAKVNVNSVCESISDNYDRASCVASMEDLSSIYNEIKLEGYKNVIHVPSLVVENGMGLVLSAVLVE